MNQQLQKAVTQLGGQTALAKSLGVTQGTVWQWMNGRRHVPPRRAIQIEHLTGGEVRADSLCAGFDFVRDATGAAVAYRVRVDAAQEAA